ncbi:MAG: hypothetical protein ACRBN8_26645 [Nannocystales bacterium]
MTVLRSLATVASLLFCLLAVPSLAHAAPGASGSISTKNGAKGSGKGGDFEWPELVYGGNAISAQLPLQFGILGYLPKARFAFQYDRQIRRSHWVHIGAALVFDRADWKNFRMNDCGLSQQGACGKGGVVGVDIYAGYTHKFFLQDRPWLVPFLRGSLGWSMFALPKVRGDDSTRQQSRTRSWTLNVKPGGGVRVFLFSEFAVGSDINLPIGFLVHRDVPEGGSEDSSGEFLLGIEVLPLVAEYRF